jgi:IS30 family transposase
MGNLPVKMRKSLTWGRGKDPAQHVELKLETSIAIYFADAPSPWHWPLNENTNGLLEWSPRARTLPDGTLRSSMPSLARPTTVHAEARTEDLLLIEQGGVATTI